MFENGLQKGNVNDMSYYYTVSLQHYWCLQVLMATNWIHILDQALLRLVWIDNKIEFPNPNEEVCYIHDDEITYA